MSRKSAKEIDDEELDEREYSRKKRKIDSDDEEERGSKNKRSKKNRKQEKQRGWGYKIIKAISIILIILIVMLAAVVAAGYGYISSLLGKMKTETIDTNQIGIDEQVDEDLRGYRNIALLGIDSRTDDYESTGNRSDCIMVASINQSTGDVKLFSVYRDSYLLIKENGTERLDKVTHAYSYGGAQNTLLALNTNLDLNITEYMTVNFEAVVVAINALGGIELDIDSAELKYINSYIDAIIKDTGVSSSHITKTGTQKVDGVQALAYARIRYTAGADYKRTQRMRDVLEAMLKKAKTLSVTKLVSLANEILPRVSTNISSGTIISMIPTLANINISDNTGWPYTISGATINNVWYGVPTTLESNVTKLHNEIFADEDYEPSDKVKEISKKIINTTGKTEGSGAETNNF